MKISATISFVSIRNTFTRPALSDVLAKVILIYVDVFRTRTTHLWNPALLSSPSAYPYFLSGRFLLSTSHAFDMLQTPFFFGGAFVCRSLFKYDIFHNHHSLHPFSFDIQIRAPLITQLHVQKLSTKGCP